MTHGDMEENVSGCFFSEHSVLYFVFCLYSAKTVHQICSCISSCVLDWLEAKPTTVSSSIWHNRSSVWNAASLYTRLLFVFKKIIKDKVGDLFVCLFVCAGYVKKLWLVGMKF